MEPQLTPHSKSVRHHPTYIQYVNLVGMPEGMKPWPAGQPVTLQFGEVRCRFEEDGVLCGAKYQSPGALRTHAKNAHGVVFACSPNTGKPNLQYVKEAKEWYDDLMFTHDRITAERNRLAAALVRMRSDADAASSARLEPLRIRSGARAGQLNLAQMNKVMKDAKIKVPCDNCIIDFPRTTTCHFHADPDEPLESTAHCINRKYWEMDAEVEAALPEPEEQV